jgi:hypothetical protein
LSTYAIDGEEVVVDARMIHGDMQLDGRGGKSHSGVFADLDGVSKN